MERVGEVWIFIWRFEAADERLQAFLFAEGPVEEAEITVGDFQCPRDVDCVVERELDTLYQVKRDGIFETTVSHK